MFRSAFLSTLLIILPASTAAGQSLQDKIGQMLMVGVPADAALKDTLTDDIVDRNIGGVLMFAYNISSPEQIRSLNAELQSYRQDHLLIAVDQEGGIVARLDEQNGYRETYTAETLGETFRSEDSTRAQARMMAHWLSEAGFNVNLAPVVDVKVDPLSPAIARLERSFSSDEQTVVDHASWFIDEFNRQHIATSLKHFPGHGSAREDSHFGFTDISDTWQERELYPFRELIRSGYSDMIMTGHLFKRDWDAQYPVSLSRSAITDVLRNELGFEGVVISDELFMKAIQDNYGFDEAIVQAINAGTDILLFNTNIYQKRSLSRYVVDLVSRKVGEGEIDPGTIDDAYDRIQK
ncbi:MAG: glycoside hydrolase family 3 protein, partial [Bacteroidota bacterium]